MNDARAVAPDAATAPGDTAAAKAIAAAPEVAPQIVIVRTHGHTEFSKRLEGYLRGSGWVVVHDEGEAPARGQSTSPTRAVSSTRAVVWIVRFANTDRYEVHIVDVRSAREVVREVDIGDEPGSAGDSAAMEAGALIVAAALEELSAEATSNSEFRADSNSASAADGPEGQARSSSSSAATGRAPSTVSLAPQPQSAPIGSSNPSSGGLALAACYRASWDTSALFASGEVSTRDALHGLALELSWIGKWQLGLQVVASQGERGEAQEGATTPVELRIRTGALALHVGPRLNWGRDVWFTPSLGAEVLALVRRTDAAAEELTATREDTSLAIAARARLMLESPGWCLSGSEGCSVHLRLIGSALGALYVRRPVWVVQDVTGTTRLGFGWGPLQLGGELGVRGDF